MNYNNFKKELGQNFIRDEDVLDDFLAKIDPKEDEYIIEIGPGDGALTERLIPNSKKAISIEVDGELVGLLNIKFKDVELEEPISNKWKVTNQNVLALDISKTIKELIENNKEKNIKIKIVGSLPYNISKPIIQKFIEFEYDTITELNGSTPEIYFLIQKEVAEDYEAKAPKSSFLSNYLQVYAKAKYLMTIDKEMFEPEPKVDGGLLKITIGNELTKKMSLEEKQKLIKFIHAGFASPRKTLLNNFKNIDFDLNKLKELKLKELIRPAELSFKDWINLYK
ncbi:MAG: rRNA adenine dimethyltransferase family protein [bacterium]